MYSLILLILPLGSFAGLQISLAHPAGDIAPQLFICDGSGLYGVPDYAVSFWTRRASFHQLQWGNDSFEETLVEIKKMKSHCFVLKDLLPNTTYWYQIVSSKIDQAFVNYTFTTPPNDGTFNIAIGSDSHFGPMATPFMMGQAMATITQNQYKNSMFFLLGDITNFGFWDPGWIQAAATLSPYTSELPFRPIAGNHDVLLGGQKYYLDYFYPKEMPVQTGSRLWYRIDAGPVHFFLLNFHWDKEDFLGEQQQWLTRQLDTIPSEDWTIIMSHAPIWDLGTNFNQLEPVFQSTDVDLLIAGHHHRSTYGFISGMAYQINGMMGQNDLLMNFQHGYSQLSIRPENITVMYNDVQGNTEYKFTVLP